TTANNEKVLPSTLSMSLSYKKICILPQFNTPATISWKLFTLSWLFRSLALYLSVVPFRTSSEVHLRVRPTSALVNTQIYKTESLPSPYQTHCVNYGTSRKIARN